MESLQIVDISVSILSTISSIICIIVHYIIPKIRKNPGNFVLIQSYLQLLVDLNWIYLSVFPDIYTSGLPCSSIGGAFAIISIINFFYCGVISLEVYFQIKSKIISSHHKRIKIYYGISALLAVFVLVFGIITDSFGENFIGFCFYKKNSLGTPAYFILYLIFITFMWFTTIVSIRKTEGFGSKIIYQYLAMVVATTIIETLNFIVLMILLLFEENQIFLQFFLISASSLGGILAFFRLWNRELIREIKWKIFPNRMEFYQEKCEKLLSSNMLALNQEPMSIAEFFENNNYMVSFKQNLLKILCALTLRFDKGNNYVIDDKDWQFFFTENEFLSVMEKVNIKNFKKCTTYLVYDPNLVIVDYSTEAFKMIREKWKVNDLELGQSFLTLENMVKLLKLQNLHGGSSGSFIFVTADKRYILKIISKEERDLMIKILPDYLERLTGYPQSYLVKIFGLFTILPENLNILLMENLLPDHENLVIFDLKGSYRNRIVFIDSFPIAGKVLKDQNFREAKIKIKCENNEIVEQLQEDFKMLSKHNIMDYSLIIGIPFKMVQSSRVIIISSDIRLGVIDILQKYNLKKIYEKNLKSIIHKSIEISAADPVTYLTRINRFLSKIFIQ